MPTTFPAWPQPASSWPSRTSGPGWTVPRWISVAERAWSCPASPASVAPQKAEPPGHARRTHLGRTTYVKAKARILGALLAATVVIAGGACASVEGESSGFGAGGAAEGGAAAAPVGGSDTGGARA